MEEGPSRVPSRFPGPVPSPKGPVPRHLLSVLVTRASVGDPRVTDVPVREVRVLEVWEDCSTQERFTQRVIRNRTHLLKKGLVLVWGRKVGSGECRGERSPLLSTVKN